MKECTTNIEYLRIFLFQILKCSTLKYKQANFLENKKGQVETLQQFFLYMKLVFYYVAHVMQNVIYFFNSKLNIYYLSF